MASYLLQWSEERTIRDVINFNSRFIYQGVSPEKIDAYDCKTQPFNCLLA